jgi:dTDP-glucose pyrophosphorylase
MRLENYSGRGLDDICAREDHTLRKTMEMMSRAGMRLVPVLAAADGRFIGVVADGDLRRFIAAGGTLDDAVGLATNRRPAVLDRDLPLSEIRALMQRRGIEYLPRVQDGRVLVMHVLWVTASPRDLTAVIMVGGLGSRLSPLTDTCPKPLLAIAGKPILTHIIEHLRDEGIPRFVLSVNYLSDMIIDHYGDGTEYGVSIDYVHETMRMGTGGALGLIDPESLSEPFLCLNGDILNDIDTHTLQLQHQSKGWDATMVVREHSVTVPYGVVKTTEAGEFHAAEEKPTLNFNINAGFYMLSKSVLSLVPRGRFYDLPTLFGDLQARNMRGGTYKHEGRWIDIGNITEFERARKIYEGHGQ